MKPDIQYLDLKKKKPFKSTLNWKNMLVCQAQDLEEPGLVPYIEKAAFDKLLNEVKSDSKYADLLAEFDLNG